MAHSTSIFCSSKTRFLIAFAAIAGFLFQVSQASASVNFEPLTPKCSSSEDNLAWCANKLGQSPWVAQLDRVMNRLYKATREVSCKAELTFLHQSRLYQIPATNDQAHAISVNVVVLPGSTPNAYASEIGVRGFSQFVVHLTSELLRNVRNESELAFILAHEIAHIRGEHFPVAADGMILSDSVKAHIARVHRSWELEADQKAIADLKRANYSIASAVALLNRIGHFEQNDTHEAHRNHPSIGQRTTLLSALPSEEKPIS